MKRKLALVLAAALAVSGTWSGLALAETPEPETSGGAAVEAAEKAPQESAEVLPEEGEAGDVIDSEMVPEVEPAGKLELAADTLPVGGVLERNDFEKAGADGLYAPFVTKDLPISEHADPATGHALQITGGSSAATVTAEFADEHGTQVLNGNEGKGVETMTEFDIKFDNLVQSKGNLEIRLAWKDRGNANAGTYIHRLAFNGAEKQFQIYGTTTGGNKGFYSSLLEDVPEIEDGRWYRIRIVIHATKAGGSAQKQVSAYIDGVKAFENVGFTSTSSGKVNIYDQIIFTGLSGTNAECKAHIDNFLVYKKNEQNPELPVDKSRLISIIRQGDKLYREAVQGLGEDEYYPDHCGALHDAVAAAMEVYEAEDLTEEAAEAAANRLYTVVENFKPNGFPVKTEYLSYTNGRGQTVTDLNETDQLVVSAGAYGDVNAQSTEPVALAAVLCRKDENFAGGKPLAVAGSNLETVDRLGEKVLSAVLDLTPFADREELFVKVMLWKDFETLYPWMIPAAVHFDGQADLLADGDADGGPDGDGTENPAAAPMQAVQTVISEAETKVTVTVPAAQGTEVTLLVPQKGMELSDMKNISGAGFGNHVDFAGQETAGEGEKAVFEFVPQGGSGNYHFYSYCKQADSFRELTVEYFDVSDIRDTLDDLYAAGVNGPAVKSILIEKQRILQVDTPLFAAAVNEGISFDKVAEEINDRHYSTLELELFRTELSGALGLALVNQSGKAETVTGVLNRGAAISAAAELGILENQTAEEAVRYERFMAFDAGRKNRMFKTLETGRDYTQSTLRDAMHEAVLVAQVGEAKSWDSVSAAFADSPDLIASAGYGNLSENQKGKVCQKVYSGRDVYSMDRLLSVLRNAIAAVAGGGSGGSTGGGGGRPASGGGITGGYEATVPNQEPSGEQEKPMDQVKSSFADLEDVPWAKEAIGVLAARGVLQGVGGGYFAPNEPVKREEFLKMAVMMFGLLDETAAADFSDVSQSDWFYPYVATGVSLGVVNGVTEELFGSGQELTRQDLALLIYRFGNIANVAFEEEGEYILFDDDEQFTACGRTAVSALAKSGVVNGTGANLFLPLSSCTRAEAAKMLYEVDKLVIGK